MRIHDAANAWIEGHAAEVFKPCNTYTFKAAVERAGKDIAGLIDGERCVGIGSRDGAERECKIGCGSAKTSIRAERRPSESRLGVRDAPDGGTKAHDVAERGGITQ